MAMNTYDRQERQGRIEVVLGHLSVEALLEHYGVRVLGRSRSRKGGTELQARCPFHDTTSVNFTIHDQRGLWHCRSAFCGKGGDLIRFVARQEDCDEDQAWLKLCSLAQIDPPKDDPLGRTLASIGSIGQVEVSSGTESPEEMAWPVGYEEMAHSYFVNRRGISPQVLQEARAGRVVGDPFYKYRACVPLLRDGRLYAIYSRAAGSEAAWRKAHPEQAEKVRSYFPRHYYTAASLTSHHLYGLDHTEGGTVVLVEAIISVLRLRTMGFRTAAALLKARISREQIKLLLTRGVDRVVICTDNDRKPCKDQPGKFLNPGVEGAWKIYNQIKDLVPTGVARLPVNVDPADMLELSDFQRVLDRVIWPKDRAITPEQLIALIA